MDFVSQESHLMILFNILYFISYNIIVLKIEEDHAFIVERILLFMIDQFDDCFEYNDQFVNIVEFKSFWNHIEIFFNEVL